MRLAEPHGHYYPPLPAHLGDQVEGPLGDGRVLGHSQATLRGQVLARHRVAANDVERAAVDG